MTRVLAAWFNLVLLAPGARAEAPDPGRELETIEATERGEDPLGIDPSTRDLAAVELPTPPPPSAQRGAALSSIPGVREQKHALHVALDHGQATVSVRMTFVSTAKYAAEIAYRLPLPSGARVVAVSDQVEALPIDDERGHALALRMGPISKLLSVEVRYQAEAPLHGGRVRFRLQGRGYDPNLAPSELAVTSETLKLDPTGIAFDPWLPIALSGTLLKRDVAEGDCARHYEATPLAPPRARATSLYIDASPSMEGPARSRLTPALAALLAVLPEATPLRAFAFAAHAEELGRFEAGAAPLSLGDAAQRELGAATKLSAIDPSLGAERARASTERVIVLSDGRFDDGPAHGASAKGAPRGADDARTLGPDSWLIRLDDAPPTRAFAHTLDVSVEAEAALHGDLGALEDRLRAIASHPSGEQRVRARSCAQRAYTRTAPTAGIPAIPYRSVPPPPPPADTGMPKESVLTMLRTQLIPQARACLRDDRKSRANYAVALTFHAVFAQREVYEPRITGSIPAPLRQCLMELLPRLRVPAFTGRIRVRYPIFTEREPEAPTVELEPETSQKLERAFAPAKALP